jgi:hypothetical protein
MLGYFQDSCNPHRKLDSQSGSWKCSPCCSGWFKAQCGIDYQVGTSTCATCAANRYGSSCTMCPCGVGGTCKSGIEGNGECTCTKGYTGTTCTDCAAQYVKSGSQCIGPCPGGDCGIGGSCTDLAGTTSCNCDAGWKGTPPLPPRPLTPSRPRPNPALTPTPPHPDSVFDPSTKDRYM